MFIKKRRQLPTWELAVIAATIAAGMVGGGAPGLMVVTVLVLIVGVYLIWTRP
jgi:hypothetical protein